MNHVDFTERASENCETLTLLHGPEAFLKHLERCLQSTRRQVDILSEDLDRELFSNETICDLLSLAARAHRQAKIRVLIKQPLAAIKSRHRFVALQQRLPSKIEFKELKYELENNTRAYIVVDQRKVLLQHHDGVYDGFCNTDAPQEARTLLEEFDWLWARQSHAIVELRNLSL